MQSLSIPKKNVASQLKSKYTCLWEEIQHFSHLTVSVSCFGQGLRPKIPVTRMLLLTCWKCYPNLAKITQRISLGAKCYRSTTHHSTSLWASPTPLNWFPANQSQFLGARRCLIDLLQSFKHTKPNRFSMNLHRSTVLLSVNLASQYWGATSRDTSSVSRRWCCRETDSNAFFNNNITHVHKFN